MRDGTPSHVGEDHGRLGPRCGARGPMAPAGGDKSWLRRLNWNPVVVALPFGCFVYRSATVGFTVMRTIGLCVVTIWFVLSVADWLTKGRVTAWIYSEDGEDPSGDGG